MENEWHPHPTYPEKKIFGRRLEPREMFKEGDMYSTLDGWERLPDSFDGAMVPANSKIIFVRPAVEEGQTTQGINVSNAT